MKDVNDDADIMKSLFQKLLKIRVRPYYLFMADQTKGTNHFRTSIETGLEIMEKLRGHTSGLAIPHFVIDAPEGGGKIPLLPKYVMHHDEESIIMRNYKNDIYVYNELKSTGNEKPDTIKIDKPDQQKIKTPEKSRNKTLILTEV